MTTEQRILEMLKQNNVSAESLLRMDLIMRDSVFYSAGATVSNYKLFHRDTATYKTDANRTHIFPLERGKLYTIAGIRATTAIEFSAAPSTTAGYNQYLFEQDSYFQFKMEKTTLNPIPLSYVVPTYATQKGGAAITHIDKQNFVAHMFSQPLIVPYSGQIELTFVPTAGLVIDAANAANPYIINAGSALEQHQIRVELIAQEWTIVA